MPDNVDEEADIVPNDDELRRDRHGLMHFLLSLETQKRIASESWLEWRRKNGRRKKLKCKR